MATLAQNAQLGSRRVFVVGVGMTKFEKPGRRSNFDYPDMTKEAVNKALKDARLDYSKIQQASVGYVYGDSTSGQRALYEIGMTGIPIYNVNNNCATGSTAIFLAKQLVEGGISNCCLALGFEKMKKGSLPTSPYQDRAQAGEKHMAALFEATGMKVTGAPKMFGSAGIEHMKRYGTTEDHLAKIAYKNHKHSVNNPNSQFQDEYSLEEIKKSKKIFGPLTMLQCCPTSDGAAAAILASEEFVRSNGLEENAVEIMGMEMATDLPSTFNEKNPIKIVGYDMTKKAAGAVFEKTGLNPSDVDVVELHDCFSANELITYEALGLCGEGDAGKLIDAGDNTYGGKYVINPSGGLISKGHPLGATGIAQCAELCWQLRGQADKRQVPNATLALQHNLGIGGAVVVSLYKKAFGSRKPSSVEFKCEKAFESIKNSLNTRGKELVSKVNGIFLFHVTNGPNGTSKSWVVDAKNDNGSVKIGNADDADVAITIDDSDVANIMDGKGDPQKLFFQGKLRIKGNMGLAMKIDELRKIVHPSAKL